MNSDPKTGGLVAELTMPPFMVALEQTHAKMKAISAVPLGELVLVVPKFVADVLGPAIQVNGRRVRVDVTDRHGSCVWLLRDSDYQKAKDGTDSEL